jgi:manganese oxidase
MDGVPFITQDPIKPGASFTYEFTVRNPGSHMYQSHPNAAEQVTKGLMGAFIIEPKDKSGEPKVDAEYILVLNDAGIGLTLNGKSFPATQPIIVKLGQTIRIRYMNEGLQIHPMHLHGLPQTVIAKDGWPVPMPYKCDTLTVARGERWDVTVWYATSRACGPSTATS